MVNNMIADLTIKGNNLLADFSFSIFFNFICIIQVLLYEYLWQCVVEVQQSFQIFVFMATFVFHELKLLDDYGRFPIGLIIV